MNLLPRPVSYVDGGRLCEYKGWHTVLVDGPPGLFTRERQVVHVGSAGQQPGPNDAMRFFSPQTTNIGGTDQGGVLFNYSGNVDLKPEKATEFEGGFDLKLLDGRVNMEATYYSKLTKDALIDAIVPPTVGSLSTVLKRNLGSVKNAGFEGLLNAQILDRRSFAWDFTFSGSTNANKLVSLGNVPPQIGATIQQRAGYPLNSYWSRRINSFDDKNGDGIIVRDEIRSGCGSPHCSMPKEVTSCTTTPIASAA